MHRLFLPAPLSGASVDLSAQACRHVRALRLREGDEVAAFDGEGGQWRARLLPGDRLELLDFDPVERELGRQVELAVGMPANERMDWLVEKATELGARAVAPLMCARGVLRLEGERAQRRLAHWRGVAPARQTAANAGAIAGVHNHCRTPDGHQRPAAEPAGKYVAGGRHRPQRRGLARRLRVLG